MAREFAMEDKAYFARPLQHVRSKKLLDQLFGIYDIVGPLDVTSFILVLKTGVDYEVLFKFFVMSLQYLAQL
jgi:hypothetical protein